MSAARAERRRQARAAARQPAEVDGLRLVWQRGPKDCNRAAMATLLGISYDDAPEAHPMLDPDVYRAWLTSHGLVMSTSPTHAPAFVEYWIAIVAVPMPHAIVMRGDTLFHNPAPLEPPDDCHDLHVMSATIVGAPEWVEEANRHAQTLIEQGSPHVWALPAPLDPTMRQPVDPRGRFISRLT